jgi:hypothetical protein
VRQGTFVAARRVDKLTSEQRAELCVLGMALSAVRDDEGDVYVQRLEAFADRHRKRRLR